MKNIDYARWRFNCALIMLFSLFMMVFAWYLLPFSQFIASVAVIVVPVALVIQASWKAFAWIARRWGAFRVSAQSNAHNRHYLLERLSMLTYEPDDEFGYGNEGYVVYDPADEHSTLVVHPFITEFFGTRYVISFYSRQFVGVVGFSDRYLYLTEEYTVVQHVREVQFQLNTYECSYEDDGPKPVEQDDRKLLDGIPDDVIARIEHALICWQRAPVDS